MPKTKPPKLTIPQTPSDQHRYWTSGSRFPRPEEFVYVLRGLGDTPVKIGKARNVHRRIATLQTGNPRELMLVGLLVGGEDLERELHVELRSHRLCGEWFDGPEVEKHLELMHEVAVSMIRSYQITKRIPDYRDYAPFSERNREARERGALPVPVSTLERKGRLSSAREGERAARYQPDKPALRFKHAAEEEPAFSPHKPSC